MKRLLLTLALGLSLVSYSQDTIKTSLDEVFINGVRASKKAPVSETTIKSTDIVKSNQSFETSTFLSKTPNVTMSTDNGTPFGYTYFRIRGIDQTRINMTLNGVPLNDAEDQGVFLSNFPSFMENIESLQIQRGVGTSTNGVSAFAGSVNFVTSNATKKETSVKFNVGSFNSLRVGGLYSTGLTKNKLAFSLNSSTFQNSGYRYNSGGKGYSFFMNAGYYGDKNTFKLTALTGRSRNGMAWLGVSEADINNDPRTNYNVNDGWDNFSQSLVQLQHTANVTDNSHLTSSIFIIKLEGGYDYLTPQYGGGDKNLFLNSDFVGGISNLNYTFSTLTLDLGISGNKYTRKHMYTFAATNTGTKDELSSFLKAKLKVGKLSLYLDGQVRYVDFKYDGDMELPNKINHSFFNPKGGVSYSLSNLSSLYYSVGLSHREASRTNLFNGNDYLDATYGFSNIKPESVVDYELGYKTFGHIISGQINLFHMSFNNEITLIGGSTPSGVGLSKSVDKSYRQGLELDFKVNLTKEFNISYNESYTNAKIKNEGEIFSPILTPKNN